MKKRVLLFTLFTLFAACVTGCDRDRTEPVTTAEPVKSAESVICDTFELTTNIRGSLLELSLDTDLPDDTVISITVDRSYWEQGNTEEYSRRYFDRESTVGEWRSTHEIDIGPAGWKRNLKEFQEKGPRQHMVSKLRASVTTSKSVLSHPSTCRRTLHLATATRT